MVDAMPVADALAETDELSVTTQKPIGLFVHVEF